MAGTEVKFGEWIERGFNLYKENLLVMILASLVTLVISSVTFGILTGPMTAGLILLTLGFYDGKMPKPDVGMVFKGFNYFLNAFLFILVWGIILILIYIILSFIPCIGWIATIFVAWAAQALLMFGLFFIVDENMEFWPASMRSIDRVKQNFWPFLGFSIVISLIGGIGAVFCGIGLIFTFPIQVCAMTVAYRDLFGKGAGSPAEEEAAAL